MPKNSLRMAKSVLGHWLRLGIVGLDKLVLEQHGAAMRRFHQHISEVEMTVWVLIGIFIAALLIFSFVFWKQVSRGAAPPPEHLFEIVQNR
jgi:hypothetical protein